MNRINILLIMALCLSACKRDRTLYTASGMKYVLHTSHSGAKPVLGDYVTFEMVYKTESDSVLFDSRHNQSPFRIQLLSIPFRGSLEEGLMCLSEGDSATFYIAADSLRAHVLREHLEAGRESLLQPGTFAHFDVRLLRVQRQADAEIEISERLRKRKEDEPRLIREYLEKEHILALPDSAGIYILAGETKQPAIHAGDTVTVNYTGTYLNNMPFDASPKNTPYSFVVGAGSVVKGWDLAFPKLASAGRAQILLPSSLAYGERGLFGAQRGNYMVPPFTPVVYNLEIVSVRPGQQKTAGR